MNTRMSVMIVDDEPVVRESLSAWLTEDGHEACAVASGEEAIERIRAKRFDACLVDLKMPGGMDGIETLRRMRQIQPDVAVVIITAYGTVDTAVEAMKDGATDYILKPFNPEDVSAILERLAAVRRARDGAAGVPRADGVVEYHGLISRNPAMHAVFALVAEVAPLRSTVLIEGELGTGKSMVARALHLAGPRATGPFVEVPCAAVFEPQLEAELFGVEDATPGAPAGGRMGRLDAARGGTILLDDVPDLSPRLQADLLRVIQERRFFRVGGAAEVPVDARFLVTASRPLRAEVRAGRFREDLYYRLNVISIQVPPLRERPEDILLLANHFAQRVAREQGRPPVRLSEDAEAMLNGYAWPGNVCELETAVERAMVGCRGDCLSAADFAFLTAGTDVAVTWIPPTNLTLREVEGAVIRAVIRKSGGDLARAAAVLGVDLPLLREKMRDHRIRQ